MARIDGKIPYLSAELLLGTNPQSAAENGRHSDNVPGSRIAHEPGPGSTEWILLVDPLEASRMGKVRKVPVQDLQERLPFDV
jgi:hypothetical protein